MDKEKLKILTQMDYAKILIEDNRFGEASDIIASIENQLETRVKNIASRVDNTQIELPKQLTKTKVNDWLTINEVWYRMKSITKEELIVSLNRNNVVKMAYKVNKNLKVA